jgi:hypothetical protein
MDSIFSTLEGLGPFSFERAEGAAPSAAPK